MAQLLTSRWTRWFGDKRVIPWVPRTSGRQAKDFAFLERLIEDGEVKAILDTCFPLEQANDAYRYVAQGDKKGHVVLTVDSQTAAGPSLASGQQAHRADGAR